MLARTAARTALLVLAGVALAATLVVTYGRLNLTQPGAFADRAVTVLDRDDVRTRIPPEVARELTRRAGPAASALRPVAEGATASAVASEAFRRILRRALVDVHRELLGDRSGSPRLRLRGVGSLVGQRLAALDPALAAVPVPDDVALELELTDATTTTLDVVRAVRDLPAAPLLAGALTLGLLLAAIAVAPAGRRRPFSATAIAVLLAGVALLVAYLLTRAAVVDGFASRPDRDAAGATWDAVLGPLRTWALIALVVGGGATAAAAVLGSAPGGRHGP